MANEFQRVERPAMQRKKSSLKSRAAALLDTITTGDAVAVPVNGEPIGVVRNRVGGDVYRLGFRHNARGRTTVSADGLFILAWLEPK